MRAADILDQMPPEALEQIQDYCSDYNKGRKGTFSAFKRAYIDMVIDHLDNARQMERMAFRGITGQDWLNEPGEDEAQETHVNRHPILTHDRRPILTHLSDESGR